MLYLRNYSTFFNLGETFAISESYANKTFHSISKLLINVVKLPSKRDLSNKGLTILLVDASEQPIERPCKNQRDYYSGKKGRHTIKAQLAMELELNMILKVDCSKGAVHDFKLFKNSKLPLSKKVVVITDLGYVGIKKMVDNVLIPYKSSKNNPLTSEQKAFNKKLSKKRIAIEHKIRECKIFRIVKDVYRGKHKNYGLMWNIIAGLVNFKVVTRHLNYAS